MINATAEAGRSLRNAAGDGQLTVDSGQLIVTKGVDEVKKRVVALLVVTSMILSVLAVQVAGNTAVLVNIYAEGQGITDERLAEMVSDGTIPADVAFLSLRSNQITDITPLAELTNLRQLWLNDNQITDISPLAELTNLWQLHFVSNKITDISPLAGLSQLKDVWLSNNPITDISPLFGLRNLTVENFAATLVPREQLGQYQQILLSRTLFPVGPYRLGDVFGNRQVTVLHALEILKYITGIDSVIRYTHRTYNMVVENPDALLAADVNEDGVIDLLDVAEIIAYTRELPGVGVLNGGKPLVRATYPMTAVLDFDPRAGRATHISLVADTEIPVSVIILEYKIDAPAGITRVRHATPNDNRKIKEDYRTEIQDKQMIILTVTEPIPAGTRILSHQLDGNPGDYHDFAVTGDSITGVRVAYCKIDLCCGNPARLLGDVNGNGVIDIFDALEILMYLSGLDSILNNPHAMNAALITADSRQLKQPRIDDVLEILKLLADKRQ